MAEDMINTARNILGGTASKSDGAGVPREHPRASIVASRHLKPALEARVIETSPPGLKTLIRESTSGTKQKQTSWQRT
jgi:hypothetical protein